jgi:CRP/FNR family transcriptional regulator, cyclic AMP receptor protein
MPHGDQKFDLIRSVPLFAHCSGDEVEAIATSADLIDVPEGLELVTQGRHTNDFVVIASGAVKVERDGAEIATLGAGSFFGEIALVTGAPRSATVTSTEACTLLVLTDRAFWRLAKEIPELPSSVLKAMAERLEPETV